MTLLRWKPEYSVGIASMDHDHQEMIGLINEFYDELGELADADAIERFLGNVYTSIAAHFALEERYMQNARYAEYESHKDDHENLLDLLRDLMDGYVDDPLSGKKLLIQSLDDWFKGHFSTFDARLHGKLGALDH